MFLLPLGSPWVPAFSRFPAVACAPDVAGRHPYCSDVSAVTVTAVACKLAIAITVEVLFDPAVRNNLASVGVPIVATFHGVLAAVL